MTAQPDRQPSRGSRRDLVVAGACGAFAALMLGAAYAAVPLYDWFCRTTGFAGTPQIASGPSPGAIGRTLTIRFDANVAGGLPWRFEPERASIDVRIGDVVTVLYHVTNLAARATTGQAAYNVTPLAVGNRFHKVNCFCFTDQTLAPNERREMPVVFYIDPDIVKDSDHDGLNTITLSYTFFSVRQPPPSTADVPRRAPRGG